MRRTYKQGAAFAVGAAAAGKVFAFITGLLAAYYFGSSGGADIYFYIILLSALLNGWLQSVNTNVVLPEFMHLRAGAPGKAMALANFFIYVYLAGAAVVCAVCFLWPAGVLGLAAAFPPGAAAQNLALVGLGALYFGSFFMMTFLVSLAESYKFFGIYFFAPLNSVLPLCFLLATRRLDMLLAGYICAYIINIIAAVIMLRAGAGWKFGKASHSWGGKFRQNFWWHQPGALGAAALAWAPLFMISAAGGGMVSALNYARMLFDGPSDVYTAKIAAVAKVKMTAEAARTDNLALAATLRRTDRVILLPLIPFCVFSAFYALDIVKLFFMRGEFGLMDAQNTAALLTLLIIAAPLVALHNNFINLLSALRVVKEVTPRYLALAVVFVIVFVLAVGKWGALAYPAVFLVLYLAFMVMNLFTAAQYAPFAGYGAHLLDALKLYMLSTACAATVWLTLGRAFESSFCNLLLNGSVFVALNALLLTMTANKKQPSY